MKNKKLSITGCIIAKNEELNIAKCIESYKTIVNQIVVVDTGSSDNTKAIAKNLGAEVYDFEWINDFSAAKNFALKKALGDWIIFLDADEYFPNGMAKNIPKYIKKYMDGKRKIMLCRMINIDQDEDEVMCDFVQGRIFKNEDGIKYSGKIHEALKSYKEEIEAVYLDEKELVIHHTGYSKNIRVEKAERNLDLLLKELKNDKDDAKLYQYIATSYSVLGDKEKSIEYLKKYIESGFKIEGMHIQAYQILIGDMMKTNYSHEEVFEVIQEAISIFKDNPMPYLYLAQWYYSKEDYEKTFELLIKTIELSENYKNIEMNFLKNRMFNVYNFLADIYLRKNDIENAVNSYIKSIKDNKYGVSGLVGFLKITKKLQFEYVNNILKNTYNLDSKEDLVFLVENIVKIKRRDLLKYYTGVLGEKFNHYDYTQVFLYFLEGEYLLAFKHFMEAYEITKEDLYLYYSAITGFITGNTAMIMLVNEKSKNFLKNMTSILIGNIDIRVLKEEDIEGYIFFLHELLQVGTDEQIKIFLELFDFFDDTSKKKLRKLIADKLKNEMRSNIMLEL